MSTPRQPTSKAPEQTYFAVPLDNVPVDITLPYPVYVMINQMYVVLRNKGDKLPQERLDGLRARGVEALYIDGTNWGNFRSDLEKSMDTIGVDATEKGALGLRSVLYAYWRTIEEQRNVSPQNFAKLRELTSRMPVLMEKNRQLADVLLKHYKDPSLYFSNHSINIAVYSVVVGLKLRMPMTELQDLALSACVANIGVIKVPREILYKPSAPTQEEWKILKEHPRYGYETLRLLLVPENIARGALEHHERCDGNGYPSMKRKEDICLFARIISVAEVFNALTCARPWGEPMNPAMALEAMRKMVGKFDPSVLAF